MAAARDKDGGDDDIYADIVDYSHEEVERLLTTCRRLHADNARLVGEAAELRTQLAAQQKSRAAPAASCPAWWSGRLAGWPANGAASVRRRPPAPGPLRPASSRAAAAPTWSPRWRRTP